MSLRRVGALRLGLQIRLVGPVGIGKLALRVERLTQPQLSLRPDARIGALCRHLQMLLGTLVVGVAQLAHAKLIEYKLPYSLLLSGETRYLVEVLKRLHIILVAVISLGEQLAHPALVL